MEMTCIRTKCYSALGTLKPQSPNMPIWDGAWISCPCLSNLMGDPNLRRALGVNHRRQLQDGDKLLRLAIRPRVATLRLCMAGQIEHLNVDFPKRFAVKHLMHWN